MEAGQGMVNLLGPQVNLVRTSSGKSPKLPFKPHHQKAVLASWFSQPALLLALWQALVLISWRTFAQWTSKWSSTTCSEKATGKPREEHPSPKHRQHLILSKVLGNTQMFPSQSQSLSLSSPSLHLIGWNPSLLVHICPVHTYTEGRYICIYRWIYMYVLNVPVFWLTLHMRWDAECPICGVMLTECFWASSTGLSVSLAFGRQRQEDPGFQASLCYIVRSNSV